MAYRVSVIRDEAGFASLAGVWDELLTQVVDANTFLSHAWLHSWWCAYRPAAELCVILAELDGRLMGIAAVMSMREGSIGWPVRKLRFIGDGTNETDHMNFIVREEGRELTLSVLLRAIAELEWDVAQFNQMPEHSANTRQTLDFARGQGWLLDTQESPCPVRHLPSSYDELLRSMPARFRTSLRSSRRRIEQAHSIEFGLHSKQDELPLALEALFRNHANRWKTKGQEGVFTDHRKRDFYAALSPRLLEARALRFFFLKIDGKVAAQEYCFEHRGNVMLLQEGFDPAFSRDNVGNVLRAMVFEHLIVNGSHTYDFLAGVSRHKRNWLNAAPNDLRIKCAKSTLRGRISFLLPRWAERLKQRVRSLATRGPTSEPLHAEGD